jgi:hypothetical protein
VNRRTELLAALLTAATLSAGWVSVNADKPLSIDDPFFVYWARAISPLPDDRPARYVNWIKFEEPLVAETTHYMPGWSILLAVARHAVGERERWLHWLQWPFAAMFLSGVFLIARTVGAPPWTSMLLCASSGAFLLPTASLMADMPAMGLGILGLALWIATPSLAGRIAGGLLLAFAGWMKQSVLVLYPLLLLDPSGGLVRRPRDWAIALCSFILAGRYPDVAPHDPERSSILGHVAWILQSTWNPLLIRAKISYLLAASGALLLTPAAYAFALAVRRRTEMPKERLRYLMLCVLGIPALSAIGFWKARHLGGMRLASTPGTLNDLWFYSAIALFLAWTIAALWPSRSATTRWLIAWFLLDAAGSVIGTWLPGVRHLIPALPPLVMFFLIDLRRSCGERPARVVAAVAIAANLWLGLSLARHDDAFARWCRDAASAGAARAAAAHVPLLTTGSWGLRYYTERAGGRILDRPTETLPAGALFLVPTLTDRRELPAALRRRSRPVGTLVSPPSRFRAWLLPVLTVPPVRAMSAFHGGNVWFPYAFSRTPSETISVLLVRPL